MSIVIPKELQVVICSIPAGTLREHETGSLSFSYHEDYEGVPLSLSMPVSNVNYSDKIVRPYLQKNAPTTLEAMLAAPPITLFRQST